jgi:hypothetical protein
MGNDLPRPSRETVSNVEIPPRPVCVIAAEAVAEIDRSLSTLRAWGVRIPENSRLDRARQILQIAAETGVLVPMHRGDDLGLRSLELAFDYAAIADTLPPVPVAALRRELRDSLIGEIEPPEAARGPLQLQSQAIVRAAFVRGGVNPTHPTHSPRRGVSSPDLLLYDGTQRYAIEAKRPQEARNIIARFDEACGQLSSYGLPGGVLVDVTDCLRKVPRAVLGNEVERVAWSLYNQVFVDEQGHKPGCDHIIVAGAFARVAWSCSDDSEESAMVEVHLSSRVGILADAPGTEEDRRAKWIRARFREGLVVLNPRLAEATPSGGAA